MAFEIERKFLLKSDEWRNYIQSSNTMRQGYIIYSHDRNLRVRIKNDKQAFLTVKIGASGFVRQEFEFEISLDDALDMLDNAHGIVIEKTRHLIHWDSHEWEIDEFSGAYLGLVIAEVELDATDDEPTIPSWIGDEVTNDRRYSNQVLATEDMRHIIS